MYVPADNFMLAKAAHAYDANRTFTGCQVIWGTGCEPTKGRPGLQCQVFCARIFSIARKLLDCLPLAAPKQAEIDLNGLTRR
jgi:hypothetical protein